MALARFRSFIDLLRVHIRRTASLVDSREQIVRRQADENHRAASLNQFRGAVDEHGDGLAHGLVPIAVGDHGVDFALADRRAPSVAKHKR